jgi:hydrogenase-4 component E
MIFGLDTLTLCAGFVFLLALLMNLVRKNTTLIALYLVQSVAVAFTLALLGGSGGETALFYSALLTLAVKGLIAPTFLFRLIRRYSAHFSAASYLSAPLSLIGLACVTAFSFYLAPRLPLSGNPAVPLLIAGIFSALFLMVNRRGALSAVVGVLSLENAVVLLSASLGAVHTFALEFTVVFDIAVWIAIATVFLHMMHRQFGIADTDARVLSHLTED